jgi:signal transduction histidine kinase
MAAGTSAELDWDPISVGWLLRTTALAVFAAIYALLVALGYGLRENLQQLTIVWPAAGLLFSVLWFTPRRAWPWILVVQVTIEVGIDFTRTNHFQPLWSTLFAAADSIDAVVGASIQRRWVAQPALPRIRQVLQFFGSTALGAAASACVGAWVSVHVLADAHYGHQWQLWWAGNWLGSLCLVPVALTWWIRFRIPALSVRHHSPVEVILIGGTLLAATAWVFTNQPVGLSTLLKLPSTILALLVVAAFRLPPRSSTVLAALVVLIAAYCTSHHMGPFALDPDLFARIGALQLFLAMLLAVTFMLTIVLLQMRGALQIAKTSDERYKNFVELSSEAVWRVELDMPMSIDLPIEQQLQWLRRHAYIGECNVAYGRLDESSTAAGRIWRADVPWAAIYLDHLTEAASQGYRLDGLEFTLTIGGRQATYLTDFCGVIEAGKLVRIWGVARDITRLTELNRQLRLKQARLQDYAQRLVGAEERARRTTAVDLHDGIGQQLVGLRVTIEAAAARAPPDVRLLMNEASHLAADIHAATQRVIADLSPPGLYELGLEPALKWLAVQMRSKYRLQVDVQVRVDDSSFDLNLRVLVYKLIRELLRNVVKHAKVQSAEVMVQQSKEQLRIEVIDKGVGFEWQMDLFETGSRGFGLWSIADRVRAAAGELTVITAPSQGCRVSIVLPLCARDELASAPPPDAPLADDNVRDLQ